MSNARTIEERAVDVADVRGYTDNEKRELVATIGFIFADVVETDHRVVALVAAARGFLVDEGRVARDGRRDIRLIEAKEKSIEKLCAAVQAFQK